VLFHYLWVVYKLFPI